MSALHEAALRAGVYQIIEREAKAQKDAAREELAALPVGDSVAGRVDDAILCKASWTKGREKVVVTDEVALLRWVKEHHPTEIIETVNPAYIRSLRTFGVMNGVGEGGVIDANGEVVPGISVEVGEPTITVRSEKNAIQLVAALISSGRVTIDGGIKELEA